MNQLEKILTHNKLDKDFVCRQILEIVDIARGQANVTVALEGMSMIAAIQGMFDDSGE